jgi:D-methionine transport system ATP-binding protein
LIQLQEVTKAYGFGERKTTAVDRVSLDIEQGEIFGIIGYSGAGKSTLLRCINLLERPSSGRVVVNGQDMTQLRKRELQQARTKIGMIFQHFHLLQSMTVADNVAFPLRLVKAPRVQVERKVRELLELVGLNGYENHYPSQLSGGQKQRVAIARALANDPLVLLSDEATSALDPETTRSILDLLLEINKKLNLTIVLVTHQMSVIRRVCDRVAVMEKGRVVEMGPVSEVFLHPKHEVTKRLVQSEDDQAFTPTKTSVGAQLLDITFYGEATYEPVLADVARATESTFSILKGTIGNLKDVPYGKLLVAWNGDERIVRQAVTELEQRGCAVRLVSNREVGEVVQSC